jgi:hypothetical protein
MNDIQKYVAERLATNGGFSHRYIAARIFGRSLEKVSDEEKRQVSGYLTYVKAKVTAWRNGVSVLAQSHAQRVETARKPKHLSRPQRRRKAS